MPPRSPASSANAGLPTGTAPTSEPPVISALTASPAEKPASQEAKPRVVPFHLRCARSQCAGTWDAPRHRGRRAAPACLAASAFPIRNERQSSSALGTECV